MVVAPIIFFIQKYPSTWRSPCLSALCTKVPSPAPHVQLPDYTISLFVNKFIKKN